MLRLAQARAEVTAPAAGIMHAAAVLLGEALHGDSRRMRDIRTARDHAAWRSR
jgi:hypothetical protein